MDCAMPCGMRREPHYRHSTPAPWSTACAGTPPSRRTRPLCRCHRCTMRTGSQRTTWLHRVAAMWIASTGVFGRPLELAVGATPLPVTGRTAHVFQHDRLRALSLYPYAGELVWLVYMTRQPGLVRALPARRLAEAASLPMIPRRRSRNCGKPWCHPSGLCRRLGRRHDHRPLARGGLPALSPGGT